MADQASGLWRAGTEMGEAIEEVAEFHSGTLGLQEVVKLKVLIGSNLGSRPHRPRLKKGDMQYLADLVEPLLKKGVGYFGAVGAILKKLGRTASKSTRRKYFREIGAILGKRSAEGGS